MTDQSLIHANWIPLKFSQMHRVSCNTNDVDCLYFGKSDSIAVAFARARGISCILCQDAFASQLDGIDWFE